MYIHLYLEQAMVALDGWYAESAKGSYEDLQSVSGSLEFLMELSRDVVSRRNLNDAIQHAIHSSILPVRPGIQDRKFV